MWNRHRPKLKKVKMIQSTEHYNTAALQIPLHFNSSHQPFSINISLLIKTLLKPELKTYFLLVGSGFAGFKSCQGLKTPLKASRQTWTFSRKSYEMWRWFLEVCFLVFCLFAVKSRYFFLSNKCQNNFDIVSHISRWTLGTQVNWGLLLYPHIFYLFIF